MDQNRSPHREPTRSRGYNLRSNTLPSDSLSASPPAPRCEPTITPAHNLRSNTPPSAPPLTAQRLFLEIYDAIINARDSKELIYENIPREIGSLVADSLADEPLVERAFPRIQFNSARGVLRVHIMPTPIHNVYLQWMKNELFRMAMAQFLTFDEFEYLELNVATTFTGFSGAYAGSSKEPDLYLQPDTRGLLPRVIVESGWSESWPHLQSDRTLWFSGGVDVRYVILLKWTKTSNGSVTGMIEVFHRNPAGAAILLHHEQLFPVPTPAVQRDIPITLDELFGPHLSPGHGPYSRVARNLFNDD
ncbi:hypothetical protein DTO027B5_1354 [Paecilomyces variotii]|nr:hypothetical protein DTO027B3_995 [Paecilomyces variotii]KAJ9336819.1 hypothetical protein DTO027B5_1354 [Paecilomyces variotii]KAJ9401280.1 hypothetical protein DTO282F9_1866 [Paecilomyces variotii]